MIDLAVAARWFRGRSAAKRVAVVVGLVPPVAVGGLDEQHVGRGHRVRIAKHGAIVAAEVAAEYDPLSILEHASSLPTLRAGARLARSDTSIPDADRHRADRSRPAAAARARGTRRLGEERQRRCVPGVALPIRLPRVFFLQPRGVGQYERHRSAGPGVQKMRPRNPCATSRGR